MPFSLPLHRPNRQARHTDNTTQSVSPSPSPAVSQGGDRVAEITDSPAASVVAAETPATTTGNPLRHNNRPPLQTVHRAPPPHALGRSSPSSPVGGRHRFDWHSVTAPPPPASSLQRHNGVARPFSASLHRPGPLHPDREPRPAFGPPVPAAGNLYPLQYPHMQHQGAELGREGDQGSSQAYKCTGPEKEHRRCFTQVGSSPLFSHPLTPSHTLSLPPTFIHSFSLALTCSLSSSLPLHPTHSYSLPLHPAHSFLLTVALIHSFSHLLTLSHYPSHLITPPPSTPSSLYVPFTPSYSLFLLNTLSHMHSLSLSHFMPSHSVLLSLTCTQPVSLPFPSSYFSLLLTPTHSSLLALTPASTLLTFSISLTPSYSLSFTLSPSFMSALPLTSALYLSPYLTPFCYLTVSVTMSEECAPKGQ